jgi:D-glycero-D-manno-heptose 1,7-bisphosphate phosphatase
VILQLESMHPRQSVESWGFSVENINEVYIQNFMPFQSEKLLILDRDGTLNEDNGYEYSKANLFIFPYAVDFLIKASNLGFGMVLATNQGGAALGKFSIEQSLEFNAAVAAELLQKGIVLSSAYICFHHPLSLNPEKQSCTCRKPKPGMLGRALLDCEVSSDNALMIGDQETDAEAAAGAGIKFRKVGNRASWDLATTYLEEF